MEQRTRVPHVGANQPGTQNRNRAFMGRTNVQNIVTPLGN